jgi:sugar lactone lactonase YvrE
MSVRSALVLCVACHAPVALTPAPEPVEPAPAPHLPAAETTGTLQPVASFYGAMPTGVAVSHSGRIFVCFPRLGDDVRFTLGEIVHGKVVPFAGRAAEVMSAGSLAFDARDRLWVLDTGSVEHGPTTDAKLVAIDLVANRVARILALPPDVARPTSRLSNMRFDLSRGAGGIAYITDSGAGGIIIVDLESGATWRRLDGHPSTQPEAGFAPIVEGHTLVVHEPGQAPHPLQAGAAGLALSPDGSRLYYAPLAGRHLYVVPTELLVDQSLSDAEVAPMVRDLGEKCAGGALESDAEGRVYTTCYEQNAVLRRDHDGAFHTIAADPHLVWPDTIVIDDDYKLYVLANQLHRQPRFHDGRDLRDKPYMLFAIAVAASPIELKPRGEAPPTAASRREPATSW